MKKCPRCNKTEWDYDVVDGFFTWCGDCYTEAKNLGFYKKFTKLMNSIIKVN